MRTSPARIAAVMALALGMAIGVAAPAQAAGPVKTLSVGNGKISVEYGQDWAVDGTVGCGYLLSFTVSDGGKQILSGTGYGYSTSLYFSSYELAPLAVGTHTLTVSAQPAYGCAVETTTVTVTVAKAPLSFDARIVSDPSAPGNAIITVQAIGDFMDRLVPAPYRDENSARFPAGTWTVRVVDSGGATVHETSIAGKLGDPGYISAYWLDAPEDSQLKATASFVPSGATAGDFASIKPDSFDYTTGQSTNAGLTKPQDDGPPADAPPRGFTLPAWSLYVAGLLAAAAIAVGVVFAVRLRRRLRRLDELEAPLVPGAPDVA